MSQKIIKMYGVKIGIITRWENEIRAKIYGSRIIKSFPTTKSAIQWLKEMWNK